MKPERVIALLFIFIGGVGMAWAQEPPYELPVAVEATEISPSVPVQPVPPAGSFGIWVGPVAAPDVPLSKGFEPFYVRLESSRSFGDAQVCAFARVGDYFVTLEGVRDAKTKEADYSTIFLNARPVVETNPAKPGSRVAVLERGLPEKDSEISAVLIPLPGSSRFLLGSYDLADNVEPTMQWHISGDGRPVKSGAVFLETNKPFFPIFTWESGKDIPVVLAKARKGVSVLTDTTWKKSTVSDAVDTLFQPTRLKTISLAMRTNPVSAACIAAFRHDNKPVVAALGFGNGPVTFAGLRSQSGLPDTEEEFAPKVIAAWQIPGRYLPFLVTARNTGGEEGTDTPEGRIILSLWNDAANRWTSVWESMALGKKIISVATTTDTPTGTTKLLVLCEDANGGVRLVSLSPLLSPNPL